VRSSKFYLEYFLEGLISNFETKSMYLSIYSTGLKRIFSLSIVYYKQIISY